MMIGSVARGFIMLTAHYGNWEILGYVMATLGFGRRDIAGRWIIRLSTTGCYGVRERHGQKVMREVVTEEITHLLDEKKTVAFVADQNAGSKGVFVDFSGGKRAPISRLGVRCIMRCRSWWDLRGG